MRAAPLTPPLHIVERAVGPPKAGAGGEAAPHHFTLIIHTTDIFDGRVSFAVRGVPFTVSVVGSPVVGALPAVVAPNAKVLLCPVIKAVPFNGRWRCP